MNLNFQKTAREKLNLYIFSLLNIMYFKNSNTTPYYAFKIIKNVSIQWKVKLEAIPMNSFSGKFIKLEFLITYQDVLTF